ncbi:MAG TPA: hypothetical protein DIW24_06500 [Bacteroidetes bacterium]|nr:hypothetical protein [Bacteroidota bacterium]HRR08971.1 hypothetical protein [Rhodothermales bacterium]
MKYFNAIAVFLTGSLLSGCMFLSTFQGPYGLEKGETALGFGASGLGVSNTTGENDGAFGLPEVQIQHGVSDRLQLGARLGIGVLGGDARYRVWSGRKVGAAVGATVALAGGGFSFSESDQETYVWGSFIPYVSVGTARIWGGVRGFSFFAGKPEDLENANLGTGIFLSGELGRGRFRFIPEIAVHNNTEGNGNFTTFGVLMRYRFGR